MSEQVVIEKPTLTVEAVVESPRVVEVASPSATVVAPGSVSVVYIETPGIQGPPGPAAPAGGSVMSVPVDTNIGGHRIVHASGSLRHASCDDTATMQSVLGITLNAAAPGGSVNVVRVGEVTEPTWNWTVGSPVYLGLNGVLTQTLPATARFSLIVGFAKSQTELFVSLREPIILS